MTLDPDAEALVRRRMRERGVSFKQALNDIIRAGAREGGGDPSPRFATATAALGTPTVNLDHALRLAAEIEDEEVLRKMRAGK